MLPGQLAWWDTPEGLRADARVRAERAWQAPATPSKPQQPCDHGLFSEDAAQVDLIEMLMDPTNES